MPRTTLSTKGQLIIPKEVRERHGWGPGTAISVEEDGDAVILRPLRSPGTTRPEEVIGILRGAERPRTLAEMEQAIAAAAAESR